jgi:integrase/recombinase XerD
MAKPTVCFNDSYVNKDGLSPLYLRVFLLGKYCKINMKLSVERKYFDETKGLMIGGTKKKEINLQINEMIGRASDIILRYQVLKQNLTPDLFNREFSNPCAAIDFIEFMNQEIIERKAELTANTIKGHRSTMKKLQTYRAKVLFVEIDELFLKGFQKFLKTKMENHTNTIHKTFKDVRTYLNIAKSQGLIKENPLDVLKVKKENTYPVFLTIQERDILVELYKTNTLNNKHQNVLRWYLFSCFTGLRISDLRAITFQNLINDCLVFKPVKSKNTTNKQITVPVSPSATDFINDENKPLRTGPIFDCYSDQKMNEYIKEIAEIAKIRKSISLHSARHTFATIFLQKVKSSSGILILQKILGHSKLETTMMYLHMLDQDLRNAMGEFDS